ncbi:mitochondrial import inner membrane translocase subunit Tim13 [Drosophila gunungcola]|uniref:mitochondrial import inner membrane translocase subunit Tim13 n=1 Tax=Drosophila gunungcola TaxID=103775 RepID=UPI0022E49252|nr:mitochondrial import inner membrane translocase subunit Tim13 [Drosophila gunungcola]
MAPNQKHHNLERIRQQIVLANIQELIRKMTRRCFNTCIPRPGLELRSEERDCVDNCMDRFLDSVQMVSRQYFRRRSRKATLSSPSATKSASSPTGPKDKENPAHPSSPQPTWELDKVTYLMAAFQPFAPRK